MARSMWCAAIVLGAWLAATPQGAWAQKLADGHDWQASSVEQRQAYVVGISNVITVGSAWDARKLPGEEGTFMRKALAGLGETTIESAIQRVDAWYASHPQELDQPVLVVIWREIAKPRLAAAP